MLNRLSYLISFVLPLGTFLFLVTGPHTVAGALAWTAPFWILLLLDALNLEFKAPSDGSDSEAFFDGILYLLSLTQLANIYLMLQLVSKLTWSNNAEILANLLNLIVIRFLVGTSSGTSGIVVAHELIHRKQSGWQWLGRLLLCTVCYEHFAIAHTRSHHHHFGSNDDMASAKLGENFKHYWRRIRAGYFNYAWQSEQERLLARQGKSLIYNEVFHGLWIEFALLMVIILHFGWLAALMFLYQAYAAVRILEAVNYFQHWGLENGQFGNTFGWVSNSSISRCALIGLSHHIGHHTDENRHFHEIAYSEHGPKLPYGYFVMNLWVKLNNASYQRMAVQELNRFKNSQA